MTKRRNRPKRQPAATAPRPKATESLLDVMEDGREYASLLAYALPQGWSPANDLLRAIREVQEIRKRPLLIYAANVIRSFRGIQVGIDGSDDLPFSELVAAVPAVEKNVDILIVTPGGLAHQVSQFVNKMRPRFDHVGFILPHMTQSAGTIWAFSGDEIWMDERAFLGPIDPQIPGKDGRLLPAQALQVLVEQIQERGEEAIKNGGNVRWADIQILRSIDPKELGSVITGSKYVEQLAAEYLEKYKFRTWAQHKSTGDKVTQEEKTARALEIAKGMCDHGQWKAHSHGISRDVAWNVLKIEIKHPEEVFGLLRAVRRLWALVYWIFEKLPVYKVFLADGYSLFRHQVSGGDNGRES